MRRLVNRLVGKKVWVCTFPEDDRNYCHEFLVPKGTIREWLNEEPIVERTVNEFLEEYCWDETYMLYLYASATGQIIKEREVK